MDKTLTEPTRALPLAVDANALSFSRQSIDTVTPVSSAVQAATKQPIINECT